MLKIKKLREQIKSGGSEDLLFRIFLRSTLFMVLFLMIALIGCGEDKVLVANQGVPEKGPAISQGDYDQVPGKAIGSFVYHKKDLIVIENVVPNENGTYTIGIRINGSASFTAIALKDFKHHVIDNPEFVKFQPGKNEGIL